MSGRISKVDVRGNEAVRIGDVLYEIDPVDFEISVASAEAIASLDAADMINKQSEAERRALLTTLSTSRERSRPPWRRSR